MLLLFISFFFMNYFVKASEQEIIKYTQENDNKINGYTNSKFTPQQSNSTYIDRAENMLLIPVISEFNEEHKNKKKSMKKSPKRTVQKIIKKNRVKLRKMFVNQVTRQPTPLPQVEHDNVYAQEEQAQWKDDTATTQTNQKRKPRKWNSKNSRYPMPFSKLQGRKDMFRRNRRSDDRKDVFILEDLDEVKFLDNNKDNDYNVVNAHVKKYW